MGGCDAGRRQRERDGRLAVVPGAASIPPSVATGAALLPWVASASGLRPWTVRATLVCYERDAGQRVGARHGDEGLLGCDAGRRQHERDGCLAVVPGAASIPPSVATCAAVLPCVASASGLPPWVAPAALVCLGGLVEQSELDTEMKAYRDAKLGTTICCTCRRSIPLRIRLFDSIFRGTIQYRQRQTWCCRLEVRNSWQHRSRPQSQRALQVHVGQYSRSKDPASA